MKLYLPAVKRETVEVGASYKDELFNLIFKSSLQRRTKLTRHALLDKAAQIRANDMATKNYFAHTSPEGVTVNEVIRSCGYVLPSYYPIKGNNCESLHMGNGNAAEVYQGWVQSPSHSKQVFGTDDFFKVQEQAGVGIARSKVGRYYTVFLTAI